MGEHSQWSDFVRFSVVGGFGVVVDMQVLFLVVDVFSFCVPLALAKLLAAETAMASNFVWNDVWTFRNRRARGLASMPGRFLRFNMVCSVGMFLPLGVCIFCIWFLASIFMLPTLWSSLRLRLGTFLLPVGLCGGLACKLGDGGCAYGVFQAKSAI